MALDDNHPIFFAERLIILQFTAALLASSRQLRVSVCFYFVTFGASATESPDNLSVTLAAFLVFVPLSVCNNAATAEGGLCGSLISMTSVSVTIGLYQRTLLHTYRIWCSYLGL